MPATCRTCPENLSGCVMVECARCGKVLCKKKDEPHNVEGVGVVVTNVISISASAGTMQNKKG